MIPDGTKVEADRPEWHRMAVDEIRRRLGVAPSGLTASEALERLRRFGPNVLREAPGVSLLNLVANQFRSPFVLMLLASAVFVLSIGEYEDALFIGIVLSLNAILGLSQEYRAERGASRLKRLMTANAVVERDGQPIEIDARSIVPGDILRLETGDIVPADVRLTSSWSLEADESILTGESIAGGKDDAWVGAGGETLADIRNMLFAGTTIARGRATGIVVETGTRTELGRIAEGLETEAAGTPPLVERMRRFTRSVGLAVTVVAVLLAAYERFHHGASVRQSVEFAVALVISAIPEGLPIALTIALAIGTHRMSRRNVIVRRLAAVEALGSCTMIATDKTGTLTCNELTVQRVVLPDSTIVHVSGEGFDTLGRLTGDTGNDRADDPAIRRLVRAGVLCNEADLVPRADGGFHRHGDAVDLALLVLGRKCGISLDLGDTAKLVHKIAYEPELRFAATWHELPKTAALLCVKGSPERVLAMCDLDDSTRTAHIAAAEAMATQGFRVLALADRELAGRLPASQFPESPSGLSFLGCVGMIDPPRHGVKQAVELCRKAGVRVVMITGDHALTAEAIAEDLGLIDATTPTKNAVRTGAVFDGSHPHATDGIPDAAVFARVTSQQKLELVHAFQRAGHFVAVTGDGANDAQALKAANLAIAMGRSGSDIARDSADLVLTDDNFASIVAGIEEGRIAYDNIRKVIVLLVSTGAGELAMVILAMLSGYPLPLLPLQLLWLNVATEAIQDEALAFEPNEGDVMARPPRPPSEPVFNRIMIERILVGAAVMGLVGFGLFAVLIESGEDVRSARNHLLLLMVLFENVHIGNCRSELKSAAVLSPLRNPLLIVGVVLALGVHTAAMHLPWFQRVLQVQPVSWAMWGILFGLALTILPAVEIHKWLCRRRLPTTH